MTADPAETPTIVTVADGLFVRQAVDSMGWIDLGEYAVVVDALEQPELEEEVFETIASTIGDRPIRYVLNTLVSAALVFAMSSPFGEQRSASE